MAAEAATGLLRVRLLAAEEVDDRAETAKEIAVVHGLAGMKVSLFAHFFLGGFPLLAGFKNSPYSPIDAPAPLAAIAVMFFMASKLF